jgi:hypothetical protein
VQGWQVRPTALLAAGISPAFVTFLLFKVSRMPLSENKNDRKYGDREDYKKWKGNADVHTEALKHAHYVLPIESI